jgi:MFS family permease
MRPALIVIALFLSGLGAAAQFGKMSVLYDRLAQDYAGQGAVALGLVVSVVGLVGLVFGTTAGLLVARMGPRRSILWAMLGGAAISAAQSLLPPFPVLLALRVAEGVSHLAIVVVGPTVIASVASGPRQGLAMALWSSFFGLTYALLALAGPPLMGWGGPQALLLAHAGWMVACAAALALLLPPDPPSPAVAGAPGLLAEHVQIYASPRIAAPALGFVFYTALFVALLTLLPLRFADPLRATVAAAMPLVSILASMTLGVWALRHWAADRLVQTGYAVTALCAIGFWAGLGQPGAMAAAAMGLAVGAGLVQGASFAAIPALNPDPADRARAAGALAQMGNLGTVTGTPVLAAMGAAMGPAAIPAFVLPLSVAGLLVVGWLRARRG